VAATAVAMVFAAVAAGFLAFRLRTTLDRANVFQATSLWNRLVLGSDDDVLIALWELRVADSSVKRAFRSELAQHPERAARVGHKLSKTLRAVGLRWTPADAQAAVTPVLKALDIKDFGQRVGYVAALRAMAWELTPEPGAVLIPVVNAMSTTINPDELADLWSVLSALPTPLTDEQAQVASKALVEAYLQGTHTGNEEDVFRAAMQTL